jgi:chorismate dehydratase
VEVAPGADPAAAGCDAWLRIGDPALRAALAADAPPAFNPSEAWTRATGLPFAFAVWIVRPGVDVGPHLAAFARARARGREALDELAARAAREWDLPAAACRRYLAEECLYEAGAQLEPALWAFRDAAAALGLCRGDLAPEALGAIEHVP